MPATSIPQAPVRIPQAQRLDLQDQWGPQVYHVAGWYKWNDVKKIRYLRDLAERYGQDPRLAYFTVNILRSAGAQPRDYRAQAAAILAWIQNNIYYVNEPNERIQSPARTLTERMGDCDDMAVLFGAMAHSIALPWKFAIAGKHPLRGAVRWVEGEGFGPGFASEYYHIYNRVQIAGPMAAKKDQVWLSAEPTLKGAPLGYDVVDATHAQVASIPEMKGAQGRTPLRGWGSFPRGIGAPLAGAPLAGVAIAPVSPQTSGVFSPISNAAGEIIGFVRDSWKDVALGTAQSVVAMLVVQYVLKRLAKKGRN